MPSVSGAPKGSHPCDCCPPVWCCNHCFDQTPAGWTVTLLGKDYYVKANSVQVANNGCLYSRELPNVTVGEMVRTSLHVILWPGSGGTDDLRIEVWVSSVDETNDTWRKSFGESRIPCEDSHTLEYYDGPSGSLDAITVTPGNLRRCCCPGCDENGTPDLVTVTLLTSPDVTTFALYLDQYACYQQQNPQWKVEFDPLELYGATVDHAWLFTVGGYLWLHLYSGSGPDNLLSWKVSVGDLPMDCANIDSYGALVPQAGTVTPDDDAMVAAGEVKTCLSGECCPLCPGLSPESWRVKIGDDERVLSLSATAEFSCTWTNTEDVDIDSDCGGVTALSLVLMTGGADISATLTITHANASISTYALANIGDCQGSGLLTYFSGTQCGLPDTIAIVAEQTIQCAGSSGDTACACCLDSANTPVQYKVTISGMTDGQRHVNFGPDWKRRCYAPGVPDSMIDPSFDPQSPLGFPWNCCTGCDELDGIYYLEPDGAMLDCGYSLCFDDKGSCPTRNPQLVNGFTGIEFQPCVLWFDQSADDWVWAAVLRISTVAVLVGGSSLVTISRCPGDGGGVGDQAVPQMVFAQPVDTPRRDCSDTLTYTATNDINPSAGTWEEGYPAIPSSLHPCLCRTFCEFMGMTITVEAVY